MKQDIKRDAVISWYQFVFTVTSFLCRLSCQWVCITTDHKIALSRSVQSWLTFHKHEDKWCHNTNIRYFQPLHLQWYTCSAASCEHGIWPSDSVKFVEFCNWATISFSRTGTCS